MTPVLERAAPCPRPSGTSPANRHLPTTDAPHGTHHTTPRRTRGPAAHEPGGGGARPTELICITPGAGDGGDGICRLLEDARRRGFKYAHSHGSVRGGVRISPIYIGSGRVSVPVTVRGIRGGNAEQLVKLSAWSEVYLSGLLKTQNMFVCFKNA